MATSLLTSVVGGATKKAVIERAERLWNDWTTPAFRSERPDLSRRDTEARCRKSGSNNVRPHQKRKWATWR